MKNSAVKRIIAVLLCLVVFAGSELSGLTSIVGELFAAEEDLQEEAGLETEEADLVLDEEEGEEAPSDDSGEADMQPEEDSALEEPEQITEDVQTEPNMTQIGADADEKEPDADILPEDPALETDGSGTAAEDGSTETGQQPDADEDPDKDEALTDGEVPDGSETPVDGGQPNGSGTPADDGPSDESETPADGEQPDENGTPADGGQPDKSEAPADEQPDDASELPEEPVSFEERYEDGQVLIQVAAEAGVIPNGAELSVRPVTAQDIERLRADSGVSEEEIAEAEELNARFEDVRKELETTVEEDETKKIAGFLAYDIRFLMKEEDGGTAEIEPNGEVKVTMEFAEAYIPEEAVQDETVRIDHVNVIHMKETGDGLAPEILEDAKTETTDSDEIEKTEFTVDSFSTFVISWTGTEQGQKQFVCELDDVIITVTAEAENVFAPGAMLQVTPIVASGEETAAQYQEVEQRLQEKAAKEAYEIAGFLAYDISFVDRDGQRLEPDGEVKVNMTYKEAAIPEALKDLESRTFELEESTDPEEGTEQQEENKDLGITVMHLQEDETGEVVDVVDMAETGRITALEATRSQEIRETEFVTDSFSTFVITWMADQTKYFEVKVHFVNTNGEEIQASDLSHENVSLNDTADGTETLFASYDPSVSGFPYKEAHYGAFDGAVVTSYVKAFIDGSPAMTFKNGGQTVETLRYTDGEVKTADIYLVYETDHISPLSEFDPVTRELSKSKKVTSNGDGTYQLDLTVAGAVGTKTNPVPVDVLLIIDRSSSMGTNGGLEAAKNAINGSGGLADIISKNKGIDARYAVVTFSCFGNADGGYETGGGINGIDNATGKMGPANASKYIVPWTGEVEVLREKISQITASGATDYQSGIELGKSVLEESERSNAQRIVVFLTDGQPTNRLNDIGTGELGSGRNDSDTWKNSYEGGPADKGDGNVDFVLTTWEKYKEIGDIDSQLVTTTGSGDNVKYYIRRGALYNQKAANESIKGLNCDAFYAIGFGSDVKEYNLNELKDNVGKADGAKVPAVNEAYSAEDSDALQQAFANIAGSVSSILCTNVSVSDTLSDHVEITGTPEVVITKANGDIQRGQTVKVDPTDSNEQGATIRVDYDETDPKNRKLKLIFEPADYQLEAGWTYQISAQIEPTEEAYQEYRDNGYHDKPDEDTGNAIEGSEEAAGLYTNKEATVTYTFDDKKITEKYPKPVIQLKTGTLVIEKKIEGLEGSDLEALEDQLAFEVTLNGISETLSLKDDFSKNEQSGIYTYNIPKLAPGTSYEVVEKNPDIEGYTVTTTPGKTGTVGEEKVSIKGEMASAAEMIKDAAKETATASFANKYEVDRAVVDLKKFGTTYECPISGAVFNVYSGIYNGDKKGAADSGDAEGAYEEITVSNDGAPELELRTGVYTLVEAKAPAGYQRLSSDIYIKVEKGAVTLIDEDGNALEDQSQMWKLESSKDGKKTTYTLSVLNAVVYELPSAGSAGIHWYMVSGTLLMMAGILILYKRKYAGRC